MTTPQLDSKVHDALARQGLEGRTIERHRELLLRALLGGGKPSFKIIDTCRRDNGAILPPADQTVRKLANGQLATLKTAPAKGYVAFVPAAGAASRYSQPLANVIDALEGERTEALAQALRELTAAGALSWPLPDEVKTLLEHPEKVTSLTAEQRMSLLRDLQLPKALMPCVSEGTSFMAMKHAEHRRLRGLDGEVYVTPVGMRDTFKSAMQGILDAQERSTPADNLPTRFLEQGPALSTIRFLRDGTPYREDDGALSLVPAGHGALASLFPDVHELFPSAHSIFIRNVDNVMGVSEPAITATESFLMLHSVVLGRIQQARTALAAGRFDLAAEHIAPLLSLPEGKPNGAGETTQALLASVRNEDERTLWEAQLRLFHTRPKSTTAALTRDQLVALYARPLNTLGQVPNTAKDIGGTPCFVAAPGGDESRPIPIKVSIEVPHVSEADKNAFLANPVKATHFNPVFVAAELLDDPDYYATSNRQFWLLAEKTYRGKPVVYFETVLYELLGNGELANTLFVEVPRLVFNPHKTLKDAVNRSVRDWLPA